MKSSLGVFSNANALLISMAISHKELITASSIAPKAFDLLDDNGKSVMFSLMNSSNASADPAGVGFPFVNANENKKVEVIFLIPGGDTTSIRFNAAKIIKRLKEVEAQIVVELKAMEEVAKTIDILGFGSNEAQVEEEGDDE